MITDKYLENAQKEAEGEAEYQIESSVLIKDGLHYGVVRMGPTKSLNAAKLFAASMAAVIRNSFNGEETND